MRSWQSVKVWIFFGFLYLYRKKVVWIVVWIECVGLAKVLIFFGFDDIGCDIGDFGVKVSEMLDFTGFGGIFI